ncbi:MAG: ribonuclease HI family protein [Candidatus Kerfeldbacteria bacterium]|nr:ribonuclease HI family protein [Candidatus Kerfeldbacteria bacterium]
MAEKKLFELRTDGGARGNPGPAGAGGWLKDPATGEIVDQFSLYLGERTNNQAEYEALVEGLRRAKKHGATSVACFLDSELLVEQMSGRYKVKNKELASLFVKAWNLKTEIGNVTFRHIPRELNKEADHLVNKAIDRAIRQ